MEDAFEVRLNFIEMLEKLNASQLSISRACMFAHRHASLSESLFECIMEELNQSSNLSGRLNLFYLIDALCQQADHQQNVYKNLIMENIKPILELVVPSSTVIGSLNRPAVVKILQEWRYKCVFDPILIEQEWINGLLSSPIAGSVSGTNVDITTGEDQTTIASKTEEEPSISRGDILKRMDEDRERHKREKEAKWRVVHQQPSQIDSDIENAMLKDNEFNQMYDDLSDFDPDRDL